MIKKFEDNIRLPVIGKIRLGVRKLSQSGHEYPSETEYFVLDDAPDVAKIYGDKPTSLEVLFPVDDLNLVMPNYYKWYSGGVKGKDGQVIGGKLNCYGTGEIAYHLAKRDPITRIVPERECLAEKCPDWKGASGKQQCKAAMSLFVLLPRVSLLGLYQIDTTSVIAIQNFVNQMVTIQKAWGTFRKNHYIIYRNPTVTNHIDDKGKEIKSTHYILSIKPDENFADVYGAALQQRVNKLLTGNIQLPSEQVLIESRMEDNYKTESIEAPAAQIDPVDAIKSIANDLDLMPLFEKLVTLKGKKNDEKIRILTARKFEKDKDIRQSLYSYLVSEIKKEEDKSAAKAATGAVDTPPAPTSPPPPQATLTADGLI